MNSIVFVVSQGFASDPASGPIMGIGLLATIGILFLVFGLGRILSWVGL